VSEYRITGRAQTDLDRIWLRIAEDNIPAADALTVEFISKFLLLGKFPELGPKRDDLVPNFRSFPVRNYLIFYRIIDDGIEIMRVVHGAQNLGTAL
jgi:toxin ParE1/3/4